MKISFDIECTPEEARRLMGLPDLADLHAVYMDRAKSAMESGVTTDMIEQMVRGWAPVGEAGATLWRQLLEQVGRAKDK